VTGELYDEDDFEVEGIDEMSIRVCAKWGECSYVSSWHLVDERKIQLNRRTKPADWEEKKAEERRQQEEDGGNG
jgi:hypothetical protein